jgi:hypothetical protein
MQGSAGQRQQAFSVWLRTGRRVRHPDNREIERKFNPWHDPDDGRFTFAGAGNRSGTGGSASAAPSGSRAPEVQYVEDLSLAPLANMAAVDAWKTRELAKNGDRPGYAEAIEAQYRRYQQAFASQPTSTLDRITSVATGLARGAGTAVYDSGKGAVTGLYSAATTNPVTTVQNVGRGIAATIDGALSAEDTPASVQISRAADAIANASAYDVGYAFGTAGSVAGLAFAPGAVAARLARAGRAGEIVAEAIPEARLGTSTSRNYRKTFFDAYPGTRGSIFVHHAVEQNALKLFPGVISESEMHSLENLRGIPKKLNSKIHLQQIRAEWDNFYDRFEQYGRYPTKDELLAKATEIDRKLSFQFRPAR